MLPGSFSVCLVLAVTLLPTALAVIFAKGRENRYDNGYSETTNSNFQLECIKWHNYFRKLHGAAPLQYSASLADYARRRAIQLAVKDGSNFYHPDDLPYGENLAWNSQEPIDCGLPLKLWYDEWKIYNFQRPNINPANGHFTQMVWKESSRIGCGQAISKGPKGGTFTVCNYDPPGNYENEELDNVSPAVGGGYDFAQESRYKQKKIKIQYTNDGHSSSTHTFSNGQYSSQKNAYKHTYSNTQNTDNYGSQSFNKWYNFRPHTSNTYQYPSKPSYQFTSKPSYQYTAKPSFGSFNKFSNFQTSRPFTSFSAPQPGAYSTYRPNFKMSFGSNSYNSLW